MKSIAIHAGEMCQEATASLGGIEVEYKSAKDLVTATDKEVEFFLTSRIKEKFPDHTIVGEEGGVHEAGGDGRWFIDPIDGTVSFVHGQPGYSVSIGYQEKEVTVAGVVYSPVLGQMFSAQRGRGAYLNDNPIHVTATSRLIEAVFATGFSCLRARLEKNNLGAFNRIIPEIRDFRRMGSAALDLAYVAAGKLDGFWEMNLNSYDVVAGALLVEEAGGHVCDFEGEKQFPERGIVATNGVLTNPFLGLLNRS